MSVEDSTLISLHPRSTCGHDCAPLHCGHVVTVYTADRGLLERMPTNRGTRRGSLQRGIRQDRYGIAMAWRSLYAETVRARMDDATLNFKQAIWIWARLVLSRVKAYGAKWYKWYVGQRFWQQSKSKVIPEKYRKYTLIEFGPHGDYQL